MTSPNRQVSMPATPAPALHSAEGCAGDDDANSVAKCPQGAAPDWSGLLCAATATVALVSAIVLQMSGQWSVCVRWFEGLFTGVVA